MTLSTNTKPIWTSQTVWGAIAAIGAGLSTAVYAYHTGDTTEAMSSLVAAFGGFTALIGRINATSQLGRTVAQIATVADDMLVNYADTQKPPIPPDSKSTPTT